MIRVWGWGVCCVQMDRDNDIDIEVLRPHIISVSNFQRNQVSTDDWMVHC